MFSKQSKAGTSKNAVDKFEELSKDIEVVQKILVGLIDQMRQIEEMKFIFEHFVQSTSIAKKRIEQLKIVVAHIEEIIKKETVEEQSSSDSESDSTSDSASNPASDSASELLSTYNDGI